MNDWLLSSLLAAAGAASAMVWLLVSLLHTGPAEDRRYKDRPPAFWRLNWWLVVPLGVRIAPLLSMRQRQRQTARLRRAGLDFSLNAEQFIAGRLVAALYAQLSVALAWSPAGWPPVIVAIGAALLGFLLPGTWLRDRIALRQRGILRQLPFFLDILILSIESGLNLSVALTQAVDKGPAGPLRIELERALRDLRAGRGREEALRGLADRIAMPAVASLVTALLVAERHGSALGPVLRAQAEQRRNERFLRAEKLAMEAPVKMLPPLLMFIFPCTFVVLLFPVASRLLQEGWLQ